MSKIPFVEYYRPKIFENIVLDPLNKKILKEIIETSYFPNLLFYGPPGTGKTTTIINLIKAYQEKINQNSSGLMIHLNASDERGIDIIRNQIHQFVNSKALFNEGMKFVVLDEVDYMTNNAQQALRYMLQNDSTHVRFCLICNYISRIDEGLQNEFLRLRFNQLPEDDIARFLKDIVVAEKLPLSDYKISQIQKIFRSDMRSMINFIQSNQQDVVECTVLEDKVMEDLFIMLQEKKPLAVMVKYILISSRKYNMDKKNIIKHLLNYIIRHHTNLQSPLLSFIESIMHFQESSPDLFTEYALIRLKDLV